jgi:hypothetical protein
MNSLVHADNGCLWCGAIALISDGLQQWTSRALPYEFLKHSWCLTRLQTVVTQSVEVAVFWGVRSCSLPLQHPRKSQLHYRTPRNVCVHCRVTCPTLQHVCSPRI